MSLPTLTVEVAFPITPDGASYLYFDDAVRGKFDTGEFAPDDSWTDISADVRSFSTGGGRQRQIERFGASTASIVLNNRSGDYDPANLSGPYVAAGVTQVAPMRRVRIRATWAGITYNLFSGFADSWDVGYVGNSDQTTTLQATDGFKVLGRFEGIAGAPAGASEDSGARVHRILNNAGWPDSDRDIDTGDSTLQATTLGSNALTELQLVADSELGAIYMGPDGKVIFRKRTARLADPMSTTSQGTFTANSADPLPYLTVVPKFDDELVKNDVHITRVGGAQQVAADTASQAKNLIATFERSDLILETDSAALDYAGWLLHVFKDAEYRFDQLSLRPQKKAGLWPHALGRAIGDRITVERDPIAGDTISLDCFIEGIAHASNGITWETTWQLSSASQYGSFLVFDDPTLGTLDSNAFAY